MLKAQFKTATAKGGAVYTVQGSPEELQAYMSSIPAEWVDKHKTEDGTPLLFASFAMPGKKDAWHPLHKVQSGNNAGRYVLDTAEIRYAELQLKGIRNATLADKMADAIVSDMRGVQVSASAAARVQVSVEAETAATPNLADDLNNVE
jgi:hypothetical protein